MQRRQFLGAGAAFASGAAERARAAVSGAGRRSAVDIASDEDFWREIQQSFGVDRSWINFNNGGVSPGPKFVQDAFHRYLAQSNEAPVHTMWRQLEPLAENVRVRLAANFGCDAEEIAITRNASEALEIVQLGLPLKAGDEVITTDQDYPRMITTWEQRVRRDGISLKKLSFPTPPPSEDYLVEMFEKAIGPKTKVIHFCHITNLTGQIFPVKRLCRMARTKGVEAVVDGAHAYSQFPFTHADLDCDYYGVSLHKWLYAPIGTGMLYMRKSKIKDVWPMYAAPPSLDANIRKFEEIGTHPAANHNAISEALIFSESLGVDRKAERLRYLRRRWQSRLSSLPGYVSRTSDDPSQSCGIALLCLDGKDHQKLHSHLLENFIITTPITRKDFRGLRITPNVYSTIGEVDRFCDVVERWHKTA